MNISEIIETKINNAQFQILLALPHMIQQERFYLDYLIKI